MIISRKSILIKIFFLRKKIDDHSENSPKKTAPDLGTRFLISIIRALQSMIRKLKFFGLPCRKSSLKWHLAKKIITLHTHKSLLRQKKSRQNCFFFFVWKINKKVVEMTKSDVVHPASVTRHAKSFRVTRRVMLDKRHKIQNL